MLLNLTIACNNKQPARDNLLSAANDNIQISIETINTNSNRILADFEELLADPATSIKAGKWNPKALLIQAITDSFNRNLQALRAHVQNKNDELSADEARQLIVQMDDFERKIFSVDEDISREFDNTFNLKIDKLDSSKLNAEWVKHIFKKYSKNEISSIIQLLQQKSKLVENWLINYCYNKVPNYTCGYSNEYQPLLNINSQYVAPGVEMEINAGVGSFSRIAMPNIFIDGKMIEVNETGLAVYNFKAHKKPGSHKIPITIKYKNSEGLDVERNYEMKYTVAPIALP